MIARGHPPRVSLAGQIQEQREAAPARLLVRVAHWQICHAARYSAEGNRR